MQVVGWWGSDSEARLDSVRLFDDRGQVGQPQGAVITYFYSGDHDI